jgi:hypothetical protein
MDLMPLAAASQFVYIKYIAPAIPAIAMATGLALGSGKELLFGGSGVGSDINNANPVNGEIKVVVESKDGTPVSGKVQSQEGVNLNLGLVYQ